MIRVHTTVFIAFPTVHTNTPRIRCEVDFPSMYGRSSSLSFSKDGREILKFCFPSSWATVCETKLSHHALERPGRIQNLLALAGRAFEPNRRYEVLEKTISRIRIVFLLLETNKRLKRARFNSKQAIKKGSIFVSLCLFWFLILAREPVIRPRGTVDVIVSTFVRIRPSTLARKISVFVFIHFQERFQTYTDSLDPIRVLVWMEGLNVSKKIRIRTNPR